MKGKLLLAVSLTLAGCSTFGTDTVKLNTDELNKARSIAERRQTIHEDELKAQTEHQLKMAQFQHDEGYLNVEAERLCFEFKKAHKLDVKAQYRLDEWNGVLIRESK